jgi:hypothetical protein
MAQIIFIGLLITFGAALVAAFSRPQPESPQVIYYISGDPPPPPQRGSGASFLLLVLFIALAIALF